MVLGWVLAAGHIPLAPSHTCLLPVRHLNGVNFLETLVARSIHDLIINGGIDQTATRPPEERQLQILAGLGDGLPVSVERQCRIVSRLPVH